MSRHKNWKNPSIAAILEYIESEESLTSSSPPTPQTTPHTHLNLRPPPPSAALDASYPTWTTPELPNWTLNGRAVLVGDAAHALQPSSGQGACQALEDAEALALFLKHHLVSGMVVPESISTRTGTRTSTGTTTAAPAPAPAVGQNASSSGKAIARALEQYEALRKPRVHTIYVRSQQMSRMKGDMGPVMEWVMYGMIYLMSKWCRQINSFLSLSYEPAIPYFSISQNKRALCLPVPPFLA